MKGKTKASPKDPISIHFVRPSRSMSSQHGESQCQHHQAHPSADNLTRHRGASGLRKRGRRRSRAGSTRRAPTSRGGTRDECCGLSLPCLGAARRRGGLVAVPIPRQRRQGRRRRLRRHDFGLAGDDFGHAGDDSQRIRLCRVDGEWVFVWCRGRCDDGRVRG